MPAVPSYPSATRRLFPGVVYSWDVSLCVERCNLHLSSRAALRPTFVIMSADEEAAVASDLAAVTAWCEGAGIAQPKRQRRFLH